MCEASKVSRCYYTAWHADIFSPPGQPGHCNPIGAFSNFRLSLELIGRCDVRFLGWR